MTTTTTRYGRRRKAIAVNAFRGMCDWAPGAEPTTLASVLKDARSLKVIQPLMAWGTWRWAVQIDGETWFFTGSARPEEFGLELKEQEEN